MLKLKHKVQMFPCWYFTLRDKEKCNNLTESGPIPFEVYMALVLEDLYDHQMSHLSFSIESTGSRFRVKVFLVGLFPLTWRSSWKVSSGRALSVLSFICEDLGMCSHVWVKGSWGLWNFLGQLYYFTDGETKGQGELEVCPRSYNYNW